MLSTRPTDAVPTSPLLERYLSELRAKPPGASPSGGGLAISERLGGPPTIASAKLLASRLGSRLATASRGDAHPGQSAAGDKLIQSLLAAHDPLEPDAATVQNIRALGDPETLVVATGQQPGFLTGPLYSVLKAASAIAAARRLTAEFGVPVVPVYWVASDDHDLSEIEGCYAIGGDGGLRRHRIDLEHSRWPSSLVQVPASAPEIMQGFLEDLPSGEHRDAVVAMLEARPGEPWARWFSRLLLQYFPNQGLVLFEPSLHPELLAPVLRRHAEDIAVVPECLRQGRDRLDALGLAAPLPFEPPAGLFVFDGERRRRYDPTTDALPLDQALATRPLVLTADAALRPVIQSSLFPVVAVVGGPGELAYWLQLTELFDRSGVPRPVFLPRLAATLVEPRVRRALEGLGLDETALTLDPLPISLSNDAEDPVLQHGRTQATLARAAVDEFLAALDSVGGPVPAKARDLKKAFQNSVDRILDLAGRHLQEQQGISQKRIALVQSSGRPRGKTQDRVLNALPFLSRAGVDLFAQIAETIDPFEFRHLLISTEPAR